MYNITESLIDEIFYEAQAQHFDIILYLNFRNQFFSLFPFETRHSRGIYFQLKNLSQSRHAHTYTRDVAHEYLRFVYSSTEYFLQTFIESWAPSIFLRLSLKLIPSWKSLRALNFLYHVHYNRGADRIFHTESPIQLHI